MADVHFTFTRDDGSTKRVPAHKLLLAAASEVFEAMFYGDLKEKGDVQVVDVSDAAFEEFLQFFYPGQVELTEENVAEVMGLGHKYNVTKCVNLCIQFVKDHPTGKYICTWLNVAILYEQTELLKLCEKRIAVNTSAVFKSADFLACDKRVLEHILKMNLLSCSETEVFDACMSWVKARSKRNILSKKTVKQHLGDLFYEIRFKSMTMQQFATLAASYDSVLSNDYKDIASLIVLPDYQPKKFNKYPRQVQWNAEAVIMCDRKVSGVSAEKNIYVPKKISTTFSSNETILLGGLIFARISVFRDGKHHDLRSDLPIDVSVIDVSDPNNKKTLLNFKSSLPSKVEKEILLPKPVLIRPGSLYEIHSIQSPEGHCYYAAELKSESRLESDITIKFQNHHTSISTGSIVNLVTALLFNRI